MAKPRTSAWVRKYASLHPNTKKYSYAFESYEEQKDELRASLANIVSKLNSVNSNNARRQEKIAHTRGGIGLLLTDRAREIVEDSDLNTIRNDARSIASASINAPMNWSAGSYVSKAMSGITVMANHHAPQSTIAAISSLKSKGFTGEEIAAGLIFYNEFKKLNDPNF